MNDFKEKYKTYKLKYYALEDPSILEQVKKELDETLKNNTAIDFEHKYNKYKARYLDAKRKRSINMITPIKDGMSYNEAKSAILDYLNKYVFIKGKEIYPFMHLRCGNRKNNKDIDPEKEPEQYINAFTLKDCVHTRTYGTREMQYITLKDETEWIRGAGGIGRLIGANYLQRVLSENKISYWDGVRTAFVRLNIDKDTIKFTLSPSRNNETLLVDSKDFTTFSLFVQNFGMGHMNDDAKKYSINDIQKITGYTDWGDGANVKVDRYGDAYIIDTEYGSFSYDNIDKLSDKTKNELIDKTFEFNIDQFQNLRQYETYRKVWNAKRMNEPKQVVVVPRAKTILDEDD
uniref:Uncharacterized protein n=1 Tax=viral metagenome TaxID=1070528 RepID=A0A6C0CAA1_9ZZZZ